MKTGALDIVGTVQKSLQKIYETTLTSAATFLTISSLDGNTDVEYFLIVHSVNGYNGSQNIGIRFNNDSGNNYGHEVLYGSNASAGASQTTSLSYARNGYHAALNDVVYGEYLIFAKSGYIRTVISSAKDAVSSTTVTEVDIYANSWNNTADNITSLVILATQTDGLGIGTRVELYRRRL